MKKFRETYPDNTIDDEYSIQEFVSQPEVLEIILSIQQLRSHIIDLICEKIIIDGYIKQSPDLEIYKIQQHRKSFTILNRLLVELFDTVIPPLLPDKSLIQCFLDKTSDDNKIANKMSKKNALFSILVIRDTELGSLLNNIIEISSITSTTTKNEFSERRLVNINRRIYCDLKKLKSEIIDL